MRGLATIGDNKPPSPFEDAETKIHDLYDEAKHWLDGEEVDSEESAEGISTLLNMLRKAGKVADTLRKEEKKPHDDAGKAVQEKYKPLADKVTRATDACKEVLTPWQDKKDAAFKAVAEEKRRLAEQAQAEAQAAIQSANRDNLAEMEAADGKVELARKLDIGAQSAANAKPATKNRAGRAIGLRTIYTPQLIDPVLAIRHYWPNAEITALLIKLAERDVRSGKREIPGFTVTETKQAV